MTDDKLRLSTADFDKLVREAQDGLNKASFNLRQASDYMTRILRDNIQLKLAAFRYRFTPSTVEEIRRVLEKERPNMASSGLSALEEFNRIYPVGGDDALPNDLPKRG